MDYFDEDCLQYFLDHQLQLFPKEVAFSIEEAQEFLEDAMAVLCNDKNEVIKYLEDEMDISQMTEEEILEAQEVFALPDGRYLVVEG